MKYEFSFSFFSHGSRFYSYQSSLSGVVELLFVDILPGGLPTAFFAFRKHQCSFIIFFLFCHERRWFVTFQSRFTRIESYPPWYCLRDKLTLVVENPRNIRLLLVPDTTPVFRITDALCDQYLLESAKVKVRLECHVYYRRLKIQNSQCRYRHKTNVNGIHFCFYYL